ncbi:MAG: hypothetical protein J6R85_05440, partial [Lentisphaeria bacterium]|nr:hypothetical protein [Lentisphaeria bacterium]
RRFNILHIAHLAKDPEQMFNAALLALIKGSGGLTHWWMEQEGKKRRFDKHPDYLRRVKAVIPVFAAPGGCRKWMDGKTVCWEKTVGSDHYFMAINAGDDAVQLENGEKINAHSRIVRKNGKDLVL